MLEQQAIQPDEGGHSFKPRPRDWLCQTAGAAAPSVGSAVQAVTSVGTRFKWLVRVYWEDTDAGGIVFYANYLKFFERSRTEWLRSLGIEQQRLKIETGGMFVVLETSLRYLRPARLDDELTVTAFLKETRRASLIIGQQVLSKPEHKPDYRPDHDTEHESFLKAQSAGVQQPDLLRPEPSSATGGMPVSTLPDTAMVLCEGTIRIGWVCSATLQPRRIPATVLAALQALGSIRPDVPVATT